MIAGDLNVDLKSGVYSNKKNRLFDELKSLHLLPMIDIPTRITNNSAKCLDHIYVNTFSPCIPGVLQTQISDHLPMFCSIPIPNLSTKSNISLKFRDICKRNLDLCRSEVEEA